MKKYLARCLTWAFIAGLALSARAEDGSVVFQGQTIDFTGATTNWVDGELVLKYTDTSSVGTLNLPGYVEARMLVVGGGGAGASPAATLNTRGGAGGGGAGGFLEMPLHTTAGGNYKIYVGRGGNKGVGATKSEGEDGQPSAITNGTTEVAFVYGGGGGGLIAMAKDGAGRPGGSGGGASAYNNNNSRSGGAVLQAGRGNQGGDAKATRAGAGGGGAKSQGSAPQYNSTAKYEYGGDGGEAIDCDITGSIEYYAGGGGGGTYANASGYTSNGGSGGSGIGGDGGGLDGSTRTEGQPGTPETGSGGGGGSYNMAGGAGGSGIVIIRIARVMPAKPPAAATYAFGDIQTIYTNTTPNALKIVRDATGETVAAITSDLGVGSHTFTSTLADGCCWSDGSSDSPFVTTVEITKPTLYVQSLTVEGWQYQDAPHDPVLVVTNKQGTVISIPEANVTYKYREKDASEWSKAVALADWSKLVGSLTKGWYEVTAEITGTDDFDPPTVIPVTPWEIWAAAQVVEGLGYSTTLTIGKLGASGTLIPIRLAEGEPSFFSYRHVQPDASDLRFTDAAKNILPMKIETWDPTGESLVWVQAPAATAGTVLYMCWGQLVDPTTGADIPVPSAETLTAPTPNYRFDFQNSVTNSGSGNPKTLNSDSTTAVYAESGLSPADLAMTGWRGHTDTALTLPTAYQVECVARLSERNASTYNVVWSIGTRGTGGCFALLSDANGNVCLASWSSAAPYTTKISTKVSDGTKAYHRYRVAVNGTSVSLYVDGVSVGSGTLNKAPTTKHLQFGSVHGGVTILNVTTDGGYSIADWSITPAGQSYLVPMTAGHLVVAEDACFKNRWISMPSMPDEWGTGEEPAKDKTFLGDPAYGSSIFTITDVNGNVQTNTFPAKAGAYTLTVITPAAGDALKTWQGLQVGPKSVNVTAHSPTSDLGGTEGSATRAGRVLLVNDYKDEKQTIENQEYDNLTGKIRWVHANDLTAAYFPNLKAGTLHHLVSTNAVNELCGSSNIWTLTNAYIGHTHDGPTPSAGKKAIYLPMTDQNKTHIVLRNFEGASIQSACYTNGIGTIYFDVVNGSQDSTGAAYQFKVEVAEGVWTNEEQVASLTWRTLDLHPLFKDGEAPFVAQGTSQHFSPNVTVADSETRFYRVYVPVNVRGPVAFRIVRETATTDFENDFGGYLLVDNIIVSYPAAKAELSTYGLYDTAKRGEGVMGYEGAWSVPFPSANDALYPKAKPVYVMNPGSTKEPEINAAKIHYRWRYLNQAMDVWKTADFDVTTMTSAKALEAPAGRVGDIEFWYDLVADAPYYKYYDYSGLGYEIAKTVYSEEIAAVTNRLGATAGTLPTGKDGTDWFVRLREGASDTETFRAIVRTLDSNTVTTVDFTLVDNHLWRGFLKMDEAIEEGLEFRMEETVPKSTAPEFVLATNYWKTANDIRWLEPGAEEGSAVPSANCVAGGPDQWMRMPCDAETGYAKFQYDDSTHVLTVTHADWQNFNKWNDAHKAYFVGNSTEDEKKSGASPKMKEFEETFSNWTDTPATNAFWREGFVNGAGDFTGWDGYKVFVPFPSAATPNGWQAGPGMWVNEKYKKTTNSGAFQMEGRGLGYLEYTGAQADSDPRGVESIAYRARLAQTIEFDDFLYNYASGKYEQTDYTFGVSALMSDEGWIGTSGKDDFDGAGQLSIIACYRPQAGCYEFRVTRTNQKKYKVELYKWTASNGLVSATWLGASSEIEVTNVSGLPFMKYKANSSTTTWRYGFMYISVEKQANGSKRIQAGFLRSGSGSRDGEPESTAKYANLCYCDTTPLADGTYGLASANCPAIFSKPRSWSQATTWLGDATVNKIIVKDNNTITLPSVTRVYDQSSVEGGWWAVKDGRYARLNDEDGYRWGFKAESLPQDVVLQCTNAKGEWVGMATNTVTGFTFSDLKTASFYRVGNARYRLRHGGQYTDARNDVVVDDFEIRQWGGDNYGSDDTSSYRGTDGDHAYPSNFVFTSGWVSNHIVQLSAKRTTAGTPCSLRSPLMDGKSNRGIGLGMMTFSYGYVHDKANILVQIATNNVGLTDLADLTKSVDSTDWVTVTNYPGSFLQANGSSVNLYLGLHGIEGVMRLVVDPAVVSAAAESTDPNYGRVDITGIYCRDEPAIDTRCWWGWNLRTLNDDTVQTPGSLDDGTRMYLPDCDSRVAGLSLALNNSTTLDVAPGESEVYRQNMPFLQTPTLTREVGELSFRARKFSNAAGDPQAVVCIYGAKSGEQTGDWKFLGYRAVTNTYYETYHYRSPGDTYKAFRLCVYGVEGTPKGTQGEEDIPALKATPVRVMLEDVVVNEAIYPELGFRYVYPVRTGLSDHTLSPAVITNASGVFVKPNRDEQPLVGENWTVQAEIAVKQLPDEIDLTRQPRVFFHWKVGKTLWGYENWRSVGKSAELKPIAGSPMVYRGSLAEAADAVVSELDADEVVQYMTSVEYWDMKGDVHTNVLKRGEWVKPDWYDPSDLNAGAQEFSAYTVLGRVSPGRAWINEVNLYDGKRGPTEYPGQENQYIEIAVPAGQSLEGWHLEYVNNARSVTNKFCFFGLKEGEVTPTKKTNETNDYAFIVVQSPKTRDAKTWEGKTRPDGTPVVIDGTWRDFDNDGGVLKDNVPIALRLVRPNQVVEQEIALEGFNKWGGYGSTDTLENYVVQLNGGRSTSHYYAVGTESNETYTAVFADRLSQNVITNTGAVRAEWSPDRHQTPGWCNEGQIVPEGWAIYANGAMLVMTAKVDPSGHISQTVGAEGPTFDSIRVSMMKGGAGTNITYLVDAWYEIESITTNGLPMALPPAQKLAGGIKRYDLGNMGAGCSNNFTVVATTRLWEDLEKKYRLDGNNIYKAAVLDWLNGNKNFFGDDFENPGEIHLAEYRDLQNNVVTNLSLTEMYWLDMDPTATNWVFKAGVTAVEPRPKPTPAPTPKLLKLAAISPSGGVEPSSDASNKNLRVTVKMFMTNTLSHASYAPYVIRGIEPGSTSYDHRTSGSGNWSAASFKITADLQNDNPNRVRWVPLRWFYFLPDKSAANKSASFNAKNEATVDVWDPFDMSRSSMTTGWENYIGTPVFYSWAIDERGLPVTVEALTPESTFD